MRIYVNEKPLEVTDESITVSELLEQLHYSARGTAVAINDRLVKSSDRASTMLKEGDHVTIISAAFGG